MTDSTITTGLASEGGHWYKRDGSPAYEITGKNGKQRKVDLRDARKLGLLPGVSAIMRLEAAPGLQRWIIEQNVLAALTLPRLDGEEVGSKAHLARIALDAGEQARKARERGTEIHAAIERGLRGEWIKPDDEPFARPVVEWVIRELGHGEAERSFAHPLGYGGKADYCAWTDYSEGAAVVDFKTKDFTEASEVRAYPEHLMQLAAYRRGFMHPTARCVNVFVSTKVPGLFVPVEHPEPALVTELAAFDCLLALWKIRRGYDPSW